MPLYLSKFSYTPETWARMIRNPEDRGKAAQAYIESVGGKLHVLLTVDETLDALRMAAEVGYRAPGT